MAHDVHRQRHIKKVKCADCGMMFTNNSTMERHIARVHTQMVYKCQICDYRAFKEIQFKLHMLNKHKCTTEMAQTLVDTAKAQLLSQRRSQNIANKRSGLVLPGDDSVDDI